VPGPEDDAAPRSGPRERLWRKAVLRPVVLGTIGLALLLISFLLYPRTTELPSPAFSRLAVAAPGIRVAIVGYHVTQVSPGVAEVEVTVELPTGTPAPPAGVPSPMLALVPSVGTSFRGCHPPACTVQSYGTTKASFWRKPLNFRTVNSTGTATADFFVKAHSFGVTANGVNASAAIPEVRYAGLGQPVLVVTYQLRSASSYDWSASPTGTISSTAAGWQQDLTSGDTPGRTAVGVNHSAQTGDDIKIFIAGALLGVAGGAVIGAVQETMHLRG
jgi:hypothetical protein